MWTHRKIVAISAAASCACSAVAWLMSTAQAAGPRELFERELDRRVDALVVALDGFGPGLAVQRIADDDGDRETDETLALPRSWRVAAAARRVSEQFTTVPLPLLMEDVEALGAWGDDLRRIADAHRARIDSALERVEREVRAKPKAFDTVYGSGVGWAEDGSLYFSEGGYEGVIVERALSVDVVRWLDDVREQARQFQGLDAEEAP